MKLLRKVAGAASKLPWTLMSPQQHTAVPFNIQAAACVVATAACIGGMHTAGCHKCSDDVVTNYIFKMTGQGLPAASWTAAPASCAASVAAAGPSAASCTNGKA